MPVRSIYRRTRDIKRNGRARSTELRREARSGAVAPAQPVARPANDPADADLVTPMNGPAKQG